MTKTDARLTRRQALGAVAATAGGLLLPGRVGAQTTPIVEAGDKAEETVETGAESRYFGETGHNLKGPFLRRWLSAGGKDVLGVPLSEDRFVDGVVVQTFETITLVYDPQLSAPWDLQSEHLPTTVRTDLAPNAARRTVTGCASGAARCQLFADSGHTVSGVFADFWQANGDLPIFGMPTTESFKDKTTGLTTQVFERAVLEDNGSGGVRLRKVAKQLVEEQGVMADPAFQPAPPTGGASQLVSAEGGLRLRALPSLTADIAAVLADNAEFIAAPNESGNWIAGYADGFAGWVAAEFLTSPPPLPKLTLADWDPKIWQGAALSETNVRKEPTTTSDVVQVLSYGDKLTVSAWVKGEEVYTAADLWAKLGEGRYVYARNVGRNAPVEPPPLPADAPQIGKWIDVQLTQQLVTAYQDRNPIRVAVTTTGMAGWETPTGFYSILRRVANETMTSGAIGAEDYFKLEDVLFTQYFTNEGHALHFAWWRTAETIGRPGSHGCCNLLLDESQFFWEWAEIGTPVYVHY